MKNRDVSYQRTGSFWIESNPENKILLDMKHISTLRSKHVLYDLNWDIVHFFTLGQVTSFHVSIKSKMQPFLQEVPFSVKILGKKQNNLYLIFPSILNLRKIPLMYIQSQYYQTALTKKNILKLIHIIQFLISFEIGQIQPFCTLCLFLSSQEFLFFKISNSIKL